jgi:Protein of unknown function (DUF3024)
MPLPPEDLERVGAYVDQLNGSMPPDVARQLRYRIDVHRNAVTIVETRPHDPADESSPWFDLPVARLRFFRSRGWELYWTDRNGDFHVYDLIDPTLDVRVLLDEIDQDPTCIFFG